MIAYPIPDAALAHHTILLGKTRAGKSSTMRGIVERLLDQGKPVGVIDPKGDWWGLKSSADGKRAGYPVIIFGGEHADVPINAHSGAHVAELVATGNRPFIIDLGGWMVGERTRFFVDFASSFFRHTRGPRHLVIDEVHNFAPQGRVLDPDSGKMLHWANRLASEGAGKGITLVSASQRPQKVHKDYVTSHETLIAMRVIHILDRNAVKDWLDGAPDKTLGKQVLDELASLDRGEAWVWSPEAKFGPVRIRFPMFKTYDSFAAPTSERSEKLKGWASVDLEDVRSKLASAVEEAKANDPRALKAEVARLTRELAAAQKSAPAPAWPDQRETVQQLVDELAETSATLERLRAGATELQRRQDAALAALQGERVEVPAVVPVQRRVVAAPVQRQHSPVVEHREARIRDKSVPSIEGVTPPQQRILDALAWWRAFGIVEPTSEQVAFRAGYSASSSGYANLKGAMRTAGLIDYPKPGRLAFTDAGSALAHEPNAPTTREAFHDAVRAKLEQPQLRLLNPLIDAYPDALSSDALADASGYSTSSSGYANLKGRMRSLGFLDYPTQGHVRAADWLFP